MKKLKFYILLTLVVFSFSCENENTTDLPENGLNLDLSSIEIKLDMTTTLNLNNVKLEDVLESVVVELYSVDIENQLMKNNQHTTESFINGVDINIKDDLITITPITNPVPNGACGSGSGWKKYDTCYSESCVKAAVEKASKELSAQLSSGKCMDLRVRRRLTDAVVCGRIVNC